MLWIGFKELIEFGEFSGTEEHSGLSKFEIHFIETKSLEERSTKEARIQAGQFWRQISLVRGIKVTERGSRRIALSHEGED